MNIKLLLPCGRYSVIIALVLCLLAGQRYPGTGFTVTSEEVQKSHAQLAVWSKYHLRWALIRCVIIVLYISRR